MFVGIDGCRAGWFYISFGENNKYSSGIAGTLEELFENQSSVKEAMIDIPIGLKDRGHGERRCDKEARKVLLKRKASVFPVPTRKAVYAESYKEACSINFKLCGKKLSKQSWFITPKIKEADSFIRKSGKPQILKEMHPELCFRAMNGFSEMQYNKKTDEGFEERLKVLKKFRKDAVAIVNYCMKEYKRKDTARDDIVDALALALAAGNSKPARTFPEEPEFDSFGLPMVIHYPVFN